MSKPNNDIKGHETRSQIMKITSQRQTWAINRRPNKLLGRMIPLTEVTLRSRLGICRCFTGKAINIRTGAFVSTTTSQRTNWCSTLFRKNVHCECTQMLFSKWWGFKGPSYITYFFWGIKVVNLLRSASALKVKRDFSRNPHHGDYSPHEDCQLVVHKKSISIRFIIQFYKH